MSERMNITVDIINPKTKLDFTAVGIMDALRRTGEANTHDVQAAVIAAGGRWKLKSDARKGLLNLGYRTTVPNHREHTVWYLSANEVLETIEVQHNLRDAYSANLSKSRSLRKKYDDGEKWLYPVLIATEQVASLLGAVLDPPKTLSEVAADLQPLAA